MNTILIVEDDININALLKEALEKEGYLCTQAFSGAETVCGNPPGSDASGHSGRRGVKRNPQQGKYSDNRIDSKRYD